MFHLQIKIGNNSISCFFFLCALIHEPLSYFKFYCINVTILFTISVCVKSFGIEALRLDVCNVPICVYQIIAYQVSADSGKKLLLFLCRTFLAESLWFSVISIFHV